MTEAYVMTLAQNAITIAVILAGPILLVSLVQAATQINEATLTFIPKIIGIILVLLILGSWMLQQIMVFTVNLFNDLPNQVH